MQIVMAQIQSTMNTGQTMATISRLSHNELGVSIPEDVAGDIKDYVGDRQPQTGEVLYRIAVKKQDELWKVFFATELKPVAEKGKLNVTLQINNILSDYFPEWRSEDLIRHSRSKKIDATMINDTRCLFSWHR